MTERAADLQTEDVRIQGTMAPPMEMVEGKAVRTAGRRMSLTAKQIGEWTDRVRALEEEGYEAGMVYAHVAAQTGLTEMWVTCSRYAPKEATG